MFRNYLKAALRNFSKNRIFSAINLIGLATGLTCFILIAVYVLDELGYDSHPADAADIYRVNLAVPGNGDVALYPNVDYGVGEGMKKAFPEIRSFTRISPTTDFVKFGDIQFKEDKLAFADSSFLNMFSLPLTEGNDKDALVAPNSVIISKALAKKYFGSNEPLGKSLTIGLHNARYKITGVFEKMPANAHFHFDAVISLSTFKIPNPTWSNIGYFTYLKLNKGTNVSALEAKFRQLVKEHVVPEVQHDMGISLSEALKSVNTFVFTLQPLRQIHLYSHTKYEMEPAGDIGYVYIFSLLALFILGLACINFTNLSIARSVRRAKEVGIRKVLGSQRIQLIQQFLSESILTSILAVIIAFGLIALCLPYFNEVANKQITFSYFLQIPLILLFLGLAVLVGIISGIYPSFFLSSFNTIKVLKGASGNGRSRNHLRSALIVFQFFVSTSLIISTMIIHQQLGYLQHKNLGYTKEQVLVIPDGRLLGNNQDAFRQSVLSDSRVIAASISRSVPGDNFMGGTQVYPENKGGNGQEIHINIYQVDYDYLKTLGMHMVKGRYFSRDYGSDSASGVVINEAAVRELGWGHTDPIGKTIVRSGQLRYTVVGVVGDFNYTSAKQKVAPLMMLLGYNYGGLIVKAATSDMPGLLADLKKKWDSFTPLGPFNYSFLDDKYAALYASEMNTKRVFSAFALLAIIIAGLGLFGLSAFVIEQRTKEIGIRKVMGASVQNILVLVSKEFLLLVALAFLLAIPVTYWAMHNWLAHYAYRIHIGAGIFMIAGCSALFIAGFTISFRALKSALANPVHALRTE